MPTAALDAFRSELAALSQQLTQLDRKTVRDPTMRERFRTLYRSWNAGVKPRLESAVDDRRHVLKIEAELRELAKLTLKWKRVAEYRKRLKRATELADGLVLELPPSGVSKGPPRAALHATVFLEAVPDVSAALVPSALLGWQSEMEAFLSEFPFDRSVFIMIRYRDRNRPVVEAIKRTLSSSGYEGILASEHRLTDDLYNPVACLLCCSRGIAVFDEPQARQEFNPNVAYELGMVHLLAGVYGERKRRVRFAVLQCR